VSFFSEVEKAIEREFRRWTAKAFGPAQSDELLLVHRAILEEVEGKVQTVQRGKRIFPYNHLRVRLVSPDAARRALFQAAFGGQDKRLEQDVRECLAAARCDIPGGFAVEIETVEEGAKGFEILYDNSDAPARLAPQARLVVVRGKANQDSFTLAGERTNIGRRAELTDSVERVIRRNDVVFEEGADEVNATVSRGHAHVRLDRETSGYRICDDSSEYGTRIFRGGRSIEVPGGGRGERLRPGDEIYLGRACLRFEE
jgi:FHA domain